MEYEIWQDNDGSGGVTVVIPAIPEQVFRASNDHPAYKEIVARVFRGDTDILALLDRDDYRDDGPVEPRPAWRYALAQAADAPVEESPSNLADETCGEWDCGICYPHINGLFGVDPVQTETNDEELRQIRTMFDEAGVPRCDDPNCGFCQGERA